MHETSNLNLAAFIITVKKLQCTLVRNSQGNILFTFDENIKDIADLFHQNALAPAKQYSYTRNRLSNRGKQLLQVL